MEREVRQVMLRKDEACGCGSERANETLSGRVVCIVCGNLVSESYDGEKMFYMEEAA